MEEVTIVLLDGTKNLPNSTMMTPCSTIPSITLSLPPMSTTPITDRVTVNSPHRLSVPDRGGVLGTCQDRPALSRDTVASIMDIFSG